MFDNLMAVSLVISAVDKLTGPVRRMQKALGNFERAVHVGQVMQDWGKNTAMMGGAAWMAGKSIAQAGASMMQPFLGLEQAMAAAKTVTVSTSGSIEKSMQTLKKAALAWSEAHKQSAEEFVRTSYMMASAGLNDVQALAGTKTALAVATATMGDATEAGNLLATIYNNLGDKSVNASKEMQRLGDIITATQQKFQIANLGQLSEGYKYATSAAKSYGISVEQLSALLGQLNTAGLQGSMAGTALVASLNKMTDASKKLGFSIAHTASGGTDFIGTLENLKRKFGDFSKLSDVQRNKLMKAFGPEAFRAIALLANQTDTLRKAQADLGNSMGITARTQKTMEATAIANFAKLKHVIDALKISLASQLLPAVQKLVPVIKDSVKRMQGFAKAHPWIVKLVMGIGVLGAALSMVGGAIGFVAGGFAMWIGKGISTIGGLIKAFMFLRGPMGKAIGLMRTFGGKAVMYAVSGLSRMASAIVSFIPRMVAWTASVWANTVAWLANPITWIVLGIMALIGVVVLAVVYWKEWTGWVVRMWGRLKAFVSNAWTALVGWLSGIWAKFKNFFNNLPAGFKIAIFAMLGPIGWLGGAVYFVIRKWALIKAFFNNLWAGIKAVFAVGAAWIRGVFASAIDWVWQKVMAVWSKVMWVAEKLGIVSKTAASVSMGNVATPKTQVIQPAAQPVPLSQVANTKQTHIGAININVKKMDKPDDLFKQLGNYATEVG